MPAFTARSSSAVATEAICELERVDKRRQMSMLVYVCFMHEKEIYI